jgi:hypothetical protein
VRLLGRYAIAPPLACARAFVQLALAVSNSLQLYAGRLNPLRARGKILADYS